MKTIITIQHPQSLHHTNGMVGSWTDWPLSELGRRQAENIGKRLSQELHGQDFIIYASDLLRAKETAEIVGRYLEAPVSYRRELRERNLGKCCGKSVQWLRENMAAPEKTLTTDCFPMRKADGTNGTAYLRFLKRSCPLLTNASSSSRTVTF